MDLICSFSLLLRDNDDDLMEAEEEDGRRPFSGVLMIPKRLGVDGGVTEGALWPSWSCFNRPTRDSSKSGWIRPPRPL